MSLKGRSWLIPVIMFVGFTMVSLAINADKESHPERVYTYNDGTSHVSLHQLVAGKDRLEGAWISTIDEIEEIGHEQAHDELVFTFRDAFYDINVTFVISNWTSRAGDVVEGGKSPVKGDLVAVRGTCRLASLGVILVEEIRVMSNFVYLPSFIGLGIMSVVILYHFKISFKKMSLVERKSGVAPDRKSARGRTRETDRRWGETGPETAGGHGEGLSARKLPGRKTGEE